MPDNFLHPVHLLTHVCHLSLLLVNILTAMQLLCAEVCQYPTYHQDVAVTVSHQSAILF